MSFRAAKRRPKHEARRLVSKVKRWKKKRKKEKKRKRRRAD